MMVRIVAISGALFIVGLGTPTLACSPPVLGDTTTAVVISRYPARTVSTGASQLKVRLPDRIFSSRINLEVLDVINGQFSGDTVLINVTSVDMCNNHILGDAYREGYVTVLSLKNTEGQIFKVDQRKIEYGAIFYEEEMVPPFQADKKPEFSIYSRNQRFSYHDTENAECILDGKDPTEAWRRCVGPGEYVHLDCIDDKAGSLVCVENLDWLPERPDDLHQSAGFFKEWGASVAGGLAILSILVGVAHFAFRRRKKIYVADS